MPNFLSDLNDVIAKMKTLHLQQSGRFIRRVSWRINKDPMPLYKRLDIPDHIIYQEQNNFPNDTAEAVLRILNRWISRVEGGVRLSVLYEALQQEGYHELCNLLKDLVR